MSKRTILLSIAMIFLSGCSTMYFHNGSSVVSSKQLESVEWHHDGVFGLVEFSDPLDMKDRCEGQSWETVKVEQTFINGLAARLTYRLYDPWETSYTCRK